MKELLNIFSQFLPKTEDVIVPFEFDSKLPKPEPKPELVNKGDTTKPDFIYLWNTCKLDDNKDVIKTLDQVITKIQVNKSKYLSVEQITKVPWYFIAATHYRETSLNFNSCLHNGDPWNKITVHVPAGRGPFGSWEEAAIDALKLRKLDKVSNWTIYKALEEAEKYNGLGYRKKSNEYSPYVWAGTNHSDETGKFVADGHYDNGAIEKQIGVAAIFMKLI